MRALMVQGCTSSAGKSLIATVLCRHFARLGVRVAPQAIDELTDAVLAPLDLDAINTLVGVG